MITKLTDKKFKISQKFWNKLWLNWKDYYLQYWLAGHNWVDFAIPSWTPLLAWIYGKCKVVNDWKSWYWLNVTIENNDWITVSSILYGHLSKANVVDWQQITVWQVIWLSWGDKSSPTSWTSTWAHLHFWLRFKDMKWNILNRSNGFQWWLDPTKYINKNYLI